MALSAERVPGGFQNDSDLWLSMSDGDERCFILARWEPYPGVEHGAVEATESHCV